jgi:hypothetical protein
LEKIVGYGTPVGRLDVKFCNHIRRIGPLPLYDARVLGFALLLCAPPILWQFLSESWLFGLLLCIALGAFLAPLSAPTLAEPDAADLYSFQRFVLKWLVGKFDIYLKLLVVGVAVWLFSKIPIVRDLTSAIGRNMFPVIKENEIEANLLDIAPKVLVVLVGMLFIRFSMFVAHGYGYAILPLLCTSWIWIEYQWFFGEVASGNQTLLSFSQSTTLIWLSDLLLSFAAAVIGFLGVKRDRRVG